MKILSEFIVKKSRKQCVCELCNTSIFKGSSYTVTNFLFEGSFNTWRMHNECYFVLSQIKVDEAISVNLFREVVVQNYRFLMFFYFGVNSWLDLSQAPFLSLNKSFFRHEDTTNLYECVKSIRLAIIFNNYQL